MIMLILWIFLCVMAGVFAAARRNRSGVGFFFLSFGLGLLLAIIGGLFGGVGLLLSYFSPLIAWLIAAVLPPVKFPSEAPKRDSKWDALRSDDFVKPPEPPAPVSTTRSVLDQLAAQRRLRQTG
jgi:hypothetical protein